jgi:hypothetical protein
MSARGLLEFAKTTGEVEITPGLRLFTREHFRKGNIVDLDYGLKAMVIKECEIESPFLFVLGSEIPGGNPSFFECVSEIGALYLIEKATEQFEKIIAGNTEGNI